MIGSRNGHPVCVALVVRDWVDETTLEPVRRTRVDASPLLWGRAVLCYNQDKDEASTKRKQGKGSS